MAHTWTAARTRTRLDRASFPPTCAPRDYSPRACSPARCPDAQTGASAVTHAPQVSAYRVANGAPTLGHRPPPTLACLLSHVL